jgi:hypothetical protein
MEFLQIKRNLLLGVKWEISPVSFFLPARTVHPVFPSTPPASQRIQSNRFANSSDLPSWSAKSYFVPGTSNWWLGTGDFSSSGVMDLDLWIANVKEGQHLAEHELQSLCEYVRSCKLSDYCSSRSARIFAISIAVDRPRPLDLLRIAFI